MQLELNLVLSNSQMSDKKLCNDDLLLIVSAQVASCIIQH